MNASLVQSHTCENSVALSHFTLDAFLDPVVLRSYHYLSNQKLFDSRKMFWKVHFLQFGFWFPPILCLKWRFLLGHTSFQHLEQSWGNYDWNIGFWTKFGPFSTNSIDITHGQTEKLAHLVLSFVKWHPSLKNMLRRWYFRYLCETIHAICHPLCHQMNHLPSLWNQ